MIHTRFAGKEIFLYLSGQAMFALDELRLEWNDGHVEPVLNAQELLRDLDAERLPVLARIAEILQRSALGALRALGQEPFEVIDAAKILALAKPLDVTTLQLAAMRAYVEGYRTDAENDEPVDVYMLENIKKKTDENPEPPI